MNHGPLDGVKVIDVSSAVSGPWAATQLVTLGAEAVMIERVDAPDVMRMTGPMVGDQSGAWIGLHGGKRAMELDITTDSGREILGRLVAEADVFIQNFRPGVAERLGIGHADLAAANERLIYVSISGFGADGPYSDQPVYDPIVQGLSGMASAQNGDYVKSFIVDKVTAMTAANAVLAALYERSSSGSGQHITVNLLDSMLAWMWPDVYWNESLPDAEPTPTYSDWYEPYDTADGQISANWTNLKQYLAATRAVGRPDLAGDKRFETRGSRIRHGREMREEFGAALSEMASAEALEAMRSNDVPSGPILDRSEVLRDPQVIHNEIIVEAEHPTAGRTRTARGPARFEGTPTARLAPAPDKGQHTEEILRELGYSPGDIEKFGADSVIGPVVGGSGAIILPAGEGSS